MDKYLKLLLEQENTIIIPGLGALTVTNEKTRELMFNEYLKFNDGKLDKFIAENSKMEEQEAKNFVAQYVLDVQDKLNIGEDYDMFEFGSFSKDNEGKIQFIPWEKKANSKNEIKNVVPVSEGLKNKDEVKTIAEKKKLDEEKQKAEADKKAKAEKKKLDEEKQKAEANKKANDKKLAFEKENKVKKEQKKQKLVNDKLASKKTKEDKPTKNVYIPTVSEDSVKTKESTAHKNNEPIKDVSQKNIKDSKPVEKNGQAPVKKGKEEKKKKRSYLFWVLLALLLIIATACIFIGLNYEKVKSYFGLKNENLTEIGLPAKNETEIEEEIEAIDNLAKDSIIEVVEDSLDSDNVNDLGGDLSEEPEVEETEKTIEPSEEVVETNSTVKLSSATGNYHIIGGNFSSESNAENLVQKLRAKGYDSKILGQFSSLTTVAIQSYDSMEAAKSALSNIRNDVEGAYIMKY